MAISRSAHFTAVVAGASAAAADSTPANVIPVPEGSALSGCLADCLARTPRLRSRAVPDEADPATGNYVLKGIPVECPAVCDLLSDENGDEGVPAAISLWIACDDLAMRDRLVPGLGQERNVKVAGVGAADPATVAVCRRAREADILLIEYHPGSAYGIASLKRLQQHAPRLRVLLLVEEPDAGLVEDILRHRLHGYVERRCPPAIISRAVQAVARGDIWLPRVLLARALSQLLAERSNSERTAEASNATSGAPQRCTSREREILELVRLGHTNKEIAHRLGIMEDTVKKHLQHVYNKLGVRRRTLLMLNRRREGRIGA